MHRPKPPRLPQSVASVASANSGKGGSVKVGKFSATEGANLAANNERAESNGAMFAGGFAATIVVAVGMYAYTKKRGAGVSEATPLAGSDYASSNNANNYGASA